ncbi:helix-turn-helix domain-containing protein [Devosia sp.]|uniref:helix-turn-helix domain-containing protein n=1 Tax=Devosia sp. TaxID=1871048 RepID=UPI00326762FA
MRPNDPQKLDRLTRPARGLLHQQRSFEHFELTRFEPSEALAPYVENYWMILWDLTGRPAYDQQNLSHPSQHLVLDPQGQTGIFGVSSGTFNYRLEGSGRVLGTKFRPGAFRGFFGRPVSALTDTFVPVEAVFGRGGAELDREFVQLNNPLGMAERIEDLLLERLPELDPKAARARQIVEAIAAQPDVYSVAQVAAEFAITTRSLQRLFDTYIGVSPKWVIDRYRMIEAVEALNRGEALSLTELAHRLGFFDQAHFTHTFQALTGTAPSAYRQA